MKSAFVAAVLVVCIAGALIGYRASEKQTQTDARNAIIRLVEVEIDSDAVYELRLIEAEKALKTASGKRIFFSQTYALNERFLQSVRDFRRTRSTAMMKVSLSCALSVHESLGGEINWGEHPDANKESCTVR